MNQTESIRGMVTLLAVHRELIRALLTIDSADAGPLVDLVGMTGAALEDAARYLGAAEVRRIVAGVQRGAAPHIAEIKADPPVKVALLRAERDALAARVAVYEAVSRDALEAMQMADTRVIGLTGSEYRQWDRAATNLRATLRGEEPAP